MNPGGKGCSEPRLCRCTPVWVAERDSVSRKEGRKEGRREGSKGGREGGREERYSQCEGVEQKHKTREQKLLLTLESLFSFYLSPYFINT